MPFNRFVAVLFLNVFLITIFGNDLSAASTASLNRRLFTAAKKGREKSVASLLKKGADVNAKDKEGNTPLIIANGFLNTVKLLLENGADPNIADGSGNTALYRAVMATGELRIFDEKMTELGYPNLSASSGLFPAGVVAALLGHGAEVNTKCAGDNTALMIATMLELTDVILVLLEKGADTSMKNANGNTALDMAMNRDYKDIVQLLSLRTKLPEFTGRRPAIAVPDLFSRQLSPGEVEVLTDQVRGFMADSGYFKVLSEQDMKNILTAQDFNESDRCDDAVCLVEMGRMLHVEKVIGGTVGRLGKRYSLSLRMVDVESGEIEHHVNKNIECPIEQLLDIVRLLASELAMEYAEAREGNES